MPARSPEWDITFDVLRDIMIGNRLYMDAAEREVMFFIYARTQAFGKSWEAVPYRHFIDGVHRVEDGAIILPPLQLSKTSIVNSLNHLVNKGLLERRGSLVGATQYRIKQEDEIDKQHVEAYIRRHQSKHYAYICKARETGVRQAARVRPGRVPVEERGLNPVLQVQPDTNGRYGAVPTPGTDPYQYNSTYTNSTNLNTTARSAPGGGLRMLSLKKRL